MCEELLPFFSSLFFFLSPLWVFGDDDDALASFILSHVCVLIDSTVITLPVFDVSCETEVFLRPSRPPHRNPPGSLFLYKLIKMEKKKNICECT